jgi:hypothetical protein
MQGAYAGLVNPRQICPVSAYRSSGAIQGNGEMMKNSNGKTSLTRKKTAIASAFMALSTVAVLTMAPMSQANAECKSIRAGTFCDGGISHGTGSNAWVAAGNAYKKARCARGSVYIENVINIKRYSVDLVYSCRIR